MKTTLDLDDDLVAELRALSRTGESFTVLVNQVMRMGLEARRALASRPPFRVQARSLGLKPGLNLDDVSGLPEQMDDPTRP